MAIDKTSPPTGFNRNIIGVASLLIVGSSFQMGYIIGVMNQPAEHVRSFINASMRSRGSTEVKDIELSAFFGLATGLFIPGAIIGSVVCGFISDRLGSRPTLIIAHCLVVIGSLLSFAAVYASAPEMIYIGRLLVGIKCGIGNCIVPMFLAEIVPYHLRGTLTTCHQLFITLGIFLAAVFGLPQLLGTASLWHILFLVQLLPAVATSAVLPFVPETPRYLLFVRKNESEALKSLAFYRRSTPDEVQTEMNVMNEFLREHESRLTIKRFTFSNLFRARDLRRALAVACSLQIVQQFSGVNAVFFFSYTIFETAGMDKHFIPFAIAGKTSIDTW